MPDLPHQFQRAALAVLLSTNSRLGRKWRANPQSVSTQDLVELGFSEEFATTRLESITLVPGERVSRLQAIALDLQNMIWDGEPPHPPDDVVSEIVVSSRAKDRERDGA